MKEITTRQHGVLTFIQDYQQSRGTAPSMREIAAHFRFRSMTTALEHVNALRQKGFLDKTRRRARSLRVLSPLGRLKGRVVDIPVYGSIPAGFAQDRRQEAIGCVSIDVNTLGVKPTPRTFAVQVRGDSMIGRHIIDGDIVVLEHGVTPKVGDVVAALIDNESTLKTYIMDRGQPALKSENPRYPNLVPARELVVQGVMMALIRRRT